MGVYTYVYINTEFAETLKDDTKSSSVEMDFLWKLFVLLLFGIDEDVN